jgi:hypothetical protein
LRGENTIMIEHLTDPWIAAKLLSVAMLAVCFLQSGLDKVFDFNGNLGWLRGHFSKTPLRGQVLPMLLVVTLLECAGGVLCAVGAVRIALSGDTTIALYGAEVVALTLVMLFTGQRIAKDYAGAATLVKYFILAAGTIVLLAH